MFTIERIKVKGSGLHAAEQLVKDQPGEWGYLGSGVYGTVYGCKDKDWVYKVGKVSCNGPYLSYIKQLSKLETHNPYTPEIYGVRIYEGKPDSGFVVAMERLKPLDGSGRTKAWAFKDFMQEFRMDRGLASLGIRLDVPAQLSELSKVLLTAKKNSRGSWDMHQGNFMMRKKQLVVTDPLA